MKEKFEQFKEYASNLSTKTKIMAVGGTAALIAVAVVIAVILNNQPYTELFSGLGQEEARQIAQKLQDDGIDYKFNGESTILVKRDTVDQTKATLVQAGYPKSGFTYDTFKDNANLLTTDSDKRTYKIYELQDRLSATLRLFKGVQDAKVTIALGEESKYVLNDEGVKPSASVTMIMSDGGAPTEKQVEGIQRLVALSVPNMAMEDVVIIDGNGNDVSADVGSNASKDASDAESLAKLVEDQVANNVMKVLGPIYGQGNVRVSARARLNMERLISESTTYTTPDKIDERDKTGIISHEETTEQRTGAGDGAGGVAGTETNSTPEYNAGGTVEQGTSYSNSATKDYLVNELKEQSQVDPGVLEDLTVAVAINGNGYGSLRENQIRSLVANAAGIAAAVQEEKITIVSAPFDGVDDTPATKPVSGQGIFGNIPLWAIIAGAVLILVLIGVIAFLLIRRRREEEEEAEELEEEETAREALATFDLNAELQELQNDRGMELKRSIREFAEQNSEISAQLLKNWLNGGVGNGGE